MSYEGVWVKQIANNIGEINNLSVFTSEYKFGDVVEFDPVTYRAMRLLNDGGYISTEMVEYSGSFTDAKAKWDAKGYLTEGISKGRLAVTKKCTEYDGCAHAIQD